MALIGSSPFQPDPHFQGGSGQPERHLRGRAEALTRQPGRPGPLLDRQQHRDLPHRPESQTGVECEDVGANDTDDDGDGKSSKKIIMISILKVTFKMS